MPPAGRSQTHDIPGEERTEGPGTSHACEWCGRSFLKASHLVRHVRSHVHEKPFSCQACGKAFARVDALQRHERTVHGTKRRRTGRSTSSASGDREEFIAPFESDLVGPQQVSFSSVTSIPAGSNIDINFLTLPSPSSHLRAQPPDSNQNPPLAIDFQQSGLMGVDDQPLDLDALFGHWLLNDASVDPSNNTLAHQVFADPIQPDLAGNGINDFFDFGSLTPDTRTNPFESLNPPSFNLQSTQSIASAIPPRPMPQTSNSRSPRLTNGIHDAHTPRASRTALAADTWESGIRRGPSRDTSPRPEAVGASRITSPEQVVGELDVTEPDPTQTRKGKNVIPSMKFLDSCLHLYFRDFHPSLPIIHRPSFHRDRTPPLLLLSMFSIGCIFMGTQEARDIGLWVYERLHYVIVFTRDTKMATETNRVAVTLSALLGQSFSFLYGQPKTQLTAEFFHGTLCSMARRSGFLGLMRENPISYTEVRDLNSQDLERVWRDWGRRETLRRACLALTIHAAELTAYSHMPRLIAAQLSDSETLSDKLFEASNAQIWRDQLRSLQDDPQNSGISGGGEIFLPTLLLAQTIVNIHGLREICHSSIGSTMPPLQLSPWYSHMIRLADTHGFTVGAELEPGSSSRNPALLVLWHYTCIVKLAPIKLIEEVAGRGGRPASDRILSDVRDWINTPNARLAVLHSGQILRFTDNLKDLAFLLPRAIFQATILILCYSALADTSNQTSELIDAAHVVDWEQLARICDGQDEQLSPASFRRPALDELPTSSARFVASGSGRLIVEGFLEGRNAELDLVSLRSTSTRLLKRCTPWGIGQTLAGILSDVVI